jgi:invasion protein IalB
MATRQYVASKSGKERRGSGRRAATSFGAHKAGAEQRIPQAPGTSARTKGSKMPLITKRGLALALLATGVAITPAAAASKKKQPAPAAPAAQPDAGAAPAQGGAPQSNVLALVPTQKDWTKVCGKDQAAGKEVCYTTRDFSAEAGKPPVLALAVYDIKGEDVKIIRMLMPIGLMLRPGFRFSVDNGPTAEGSYEICFPNGCFAESKVRTSSVDTMKGGTKLAVSVRNQANNEVTFAVPLAGFGKAFDGPAIDPEVLRKQQEQLQAGLQKQAEEERKRLEAQKANGGAAGGAAIPKQ